MPVKADVVAGASKLCPGARRSFFCRIKCKASPEVAAANTAATPVKEESEPHAKLRKKQPQEKRYCVVQCTGTPSSKFFYNFDLYVIVISL